MAKMMIVGMRPYRFTPEGQSEELSGYTVWALEQAKSPGIGQLPVKLGMNPDKYDEIIGMLGGMDKLLGQMVDVSFDRYGKAESMALLK